MVDIICYWLRAGEVGWSYPTWVVYCVDEEGNQLWESEYYSNKAALKAAWGIK